MKRKVLMGLIAGAILFGGAVGVGALADDSNKEVSSAQVVVKSSNEKVNSDDRHNESRGSGNQGSDDRYGDDRRSDDKGSDDQYDDNPTFHQNQTVEISKDEAVAIATKDTPGQVSKVELDDYRYYEIEVKNGQYEVEYKIDAHTGAILEKDIDHEDD
ncbi:PepSY domain-containing protein [Bacillus sp. T3]|uniref:PepSY domain-containing protein n=1 Tax=Bacillus sp. T3 TaxID=467262 RepID=UPI0029815B4F|nr:PepSY domain-containing protein [Bacillus sp. T3]